MTTDTTDQESTADPIQANSLGWPRGAADQFRQLNGELPSDPNMWDRCYTLSVVDTEGNVLASGVKVSALEAERLANYGVEQLLKITFLPPADTERPGEVWDTERCCWTSLDAGDSDADEPPEAGE